MCEKVQEYGNWKQLMRGLVSGGVNMLWPKGMKAERTGAVLGRTKVGWSPLGIRIG